MTHHNEIIFELPEGFCFCFLGGTGGQTVFLPNTLSVFHHQLCEIKYFHAKYSFLVVCVIPPHSLLPTPSSFPHLHIHLPVYWCDVIQCLTHLHVHSTCKDNCTRGRSHVLDFLFYFGSTFLPLLGNLGHLTMVTHSIRKSSTTYSSQRVQYFCVSKQWYG